MAELAARTDDRQSPPAAIEVRGARIHNLRNLHVRVPHGRLVVITGPSGSGKSSLAFDTIFAEGRRQYIESLSAYARQFLRQLERPDVDLVEGLQPTVCIDQLPGANNPRSTVATTTEIYDYLRLLMARVGEAACPQCGAPVRQQSPEQIEQRLAGLPEGAKLMLLAPMIRGKRGRHQEVLEKIRKAGLVRARIDGQVYDLDLAPELNARQTHDIEAVVDRIVVREGVEARLAESVRLTLKQGDGVLIACRLDEAAATPQHPRGQWRDELFSTLAACPDCHLSVAELEPRTFSFSSPYGACPACDGLGVIDGFDPDLAVDADKSLNAGAVLPWRTAALRRSRLKQLQPLLPAAGADPDAAWSSLSETARRLLWQGRPDQLGVLGLLEQEFATCTRETRLEELAAFRGAARCHACQGARLRPESLAVRLGDRNIHDIVSLPVDRALEFFEQLTFPASQQPISDPLTTEIIRRLKFLRHVGLNYLTLQRPVDTLSGGERQRVRLATCIGSGLVGVCYILDEPSIGLHPRDNQRLLDSLRDLQQQGNTVIVVEHDEDAMRAADHVIDMGPGAGKHGGAIVAEGSPEEIMRTDGCLTGDFLAGRRQVQWPAPRRTPDPSRRLVLHGATANNLKDVRLDLPLGLLVCVTGVSGSGKSSLIMETLAPAVSRALGQGGPKPAAFRKLEGLQHLDKLIQIDQTPIGRSPRSNPATYIGAFDEIRKLFAATRDARQKGYRASRFSFNVKGGRCETCQGQGVKRIEMNFLPDMFVPCEDCRGARFNRATLQVKFKGRSIADVLNMMLEDATEFFANAPSLHRMLQCLVDVGLGYLHLGQPSTTLSGGEAQRVKLAAQLARTDTGSTLYILDEPTTGLHFEDIQRLLNVLQRLVDRGNTVLVIEHQTDIIRAADWLVDLGPEGGELGGEIVVAGSPPEVEACPRSHTGRHLQGRPE